MYYKDQEKVQAEIVRLSQIRRRNRNMQDKVRLLQLKLYDKANREEGYRFYILYDKVFQDHILKLAYARVKSKDGSPGIDGQGIADIEKSGREKFLKELQESLRKRSYRPQAVRRVYVEKENGGTRPLGIPTIRDRVAQTALKLVIEPIFEADFEDLSYGFRPKRDGKGAMERVKAHLKAGRTEVYDADLSKYFDTIPHDRLLKVLGLRISDPRILALIKSWLKAPIVEDGRYTGGRKGNRGTPQGGVISPLLANIYLHLIDRIIANPKGSYARYGIKMVRYADDFVIMGKTLPETAIRRILCLLGRMGLEINEDKTKYIDARKEPFNFLGFTISYDRNLFGKGRYWNIAPSSRSSKRLRRKIKERLKQIGHYSPENIVKELNPIIRGWFNYYDIKGVSYTQMARRSLNHYLGNRIERYYNRKSQRRSSLYGTQAYELLTNKYGLINPYSPSGLKPMKFGHESMRKAVCGKTARPV